MELDEVITRSSICESSSSFFGGWAEGTVFTFNSAKNTINSYHQQSEDESSQDLNSVCKSNRKKGVFGRLREWMDKENGGWKEEENRFVKFLEEQARVHARKNWNSTKAFVAYHNRGNRYYKLNTRSDHTRIVEAKARHDDVLERQVETDLTQEDVVETGESDEAKATEDREEKSSDVAFETQVGESDPPMARSFISIKELVSYNKNRVPEKKMKSTSPKRNQKTPGSWESRRSSDNLVKSPSQIKSASKARVDAKRSDDLRAELVEGKILKVYGGCVCVVSPNSMQEAMIISDKGTLKVLQNKMDLVSSQIGVTEKDKSVPTDMPTNLSESQDATTEGLSSLGVSPRRSVNSTLNSKKTDGTGKSCACIPNQDLVCEACTGISRKPKQNNDTKEAIQKNAKRRFKHRGSVGNSMTYRSLFGKRAVYEPGMGKESQSTFLRKVKKRKQDKAGGDINNSTESLESTFSALEVRSKAEIEPCPPVPVEVEVKERQLENHQEPSVKRCKLPTESSSPKGVAACSGACTDLLFSLQQQQEAERSSHEEASIQLLEEKMLKAFETDFKEREVFKDSPQSTRKVPCLKMSKVAKEELAEPVSRREADINSSKLDLKLSRRTVRPEEMFPELVSSSIQKKKSGVLVEDHKESVPQVHATVQVPETQKEPTKPQIPFFGDLENDREQRMPLLGHAEHKNAGMKSASAGRKFIPHPPRSPYAPSSLARSPIPKSFQFLNNGSKTREPQQKQQKRYMPLVRAVPDEYEASPHSHRQSNAGYQSVQSGYGANSFRQQADATWEDNHRSYMQRCYSAPEQTYQQRGADSGTPARYPTQKAHSSDAENVFLERFSQMPKEEAFQNPLHQLQPSWSDSGNRNLYISRPPPPPQLQPQLQPHPQVQRQFQPQPQLQHQFQHQPQVQHQFQPQPQLQPQPQPSRQVWNNKFYQPDLQAKSSLWVPVNDTYRQHEVQPKSPFGLPVADDYLRSSSGHLPTYQKPDRNRIQPESRTRMGYINSAHYHGTHQQLSLVPYPPVAECAPVKTPETPHLLTEEEAEIILRIRHTVGQTKQEGTENFNVSHASRESVHCKIPVRPNILQASAVNAPCKKPPLIQSSCVPAEASASSREEKKSRQQPRKVATERDLQLQKEAARTIKLQSAALKIQQVWKFRKYRQKLRMQHQLKLRAEHQEILSCKSREQRAIRKIQKAWRDFVKRRPSILPRTMTGLYNVIKKRKLSKGIAMPTYEKFQALVCRVQAATEGARVRRRLTSRRLQGMVKEIKEICLFLDEASKDGTSPRLLSQLSNQLQQKRLQLDTALNCPGMAAKFLLKRCPATPIF